MGDLHHLPLLGHDLPRPAARRRARVYKDGPAWRWAHGCGWDDFGRSPFLSQPLALKFALRHMEECW